MVKSTIALARSTSCSIDDLTIEAQADFHIGFPGSCPAYPGCKCILGFEPCDEFVQFNRERLVQERIVDLSRQRLASLVSKSLVGDNL